MPLVKKIDPTWRPAEAPGIRVGEMIFMTDSEALVAQGKVEIVEEDVARKVVEEAKEEAITNSTVEVEGVEYEYEDAEVIEVEEEDEEKFICEVCGKEYASQSWLTRHMNQEHKE